MPLRYPACRSAVITITSNAIELPAVPAKMYTPNMVEYQRKLRLIIQSTAPKVRQMANRGRLMNDTRRIQIVNSGFPSLSWREENRRSKSDATIQKAKKMNARMRNQWVLRYARLESRFGARPGGISIH